MPNIKLIQSIHVIADMLPGNGSPHLSSPILVRLDTTGIQAACAAGGGANAFGQTDLYEAQQRPLIPVHLLEPLFPVLCYLILVVPPSALLPPQCTSYQSRRVADAQLGKLQYTPPAPCNTTHKFVRRHVLHLGRVVRRQRVDSTIQACQQRSPPACLHLDRHCYCTVSRRLSRLEVGPLLRDPWHPLHQCSPTPGHRITTTTTVGTVGM